MPSALLAILASLSLGSGPGLRERSLDVINTHFHRAPGFKAHAAVPPYGVANSSHAGRRHEQCAADGKVCPACSPDWRYCPCRRFETTGKTYGCGLEWDDWVMVKALVTPATVILEAGARFGTTSCTIAHAMGNSGMVVSVEPDASVIPALLRNRDANHCNVHVFSGSVSAQRMFLNPHDYGSHTSKVPSELYRSAAFEVPNVSYRQLEAAIGARFNAVLIDCEGCIETLPLPLLEQVDLILIEEDGFRQVNYQKWHKWFKSQGFTRVWYARDSVFPAATNDFRLLRHSAWQRGGRTEATPTCGAYAARERLPAGLLSCIAE